MESKYIKFILCAALLGACGPVSKVEPSDEYKIGETVQQVSPLTLRNGNEQEHVAIFDKTTRRIHQFDLSGNAHVRTLGVTKPEEDHYLLYKEAGGYIVDFAKKDLTIFRSDSTSHINPIRFSGTPISSALEPDNNYVVIYDDVSSIGLLKLSDDGVVESSWVGGPVLEISSTDKATVVSGDITENGKLVLALSDNSIAVVDLAQTLAQKKWVFTNFATTLELISWVAPLRGTPDRVFVKASGKSAILDISTQTVVSEVAVDGTMIKLSKTPNPHMIFKKDAETRVFYVDGNNVKTKSVFSPFGDILASRLNIAEDTWTVVEAPATPKIVWWFETIDDRPVGRSLKRFRFSDLLASENQVVPDNAQIHLSQNYVFALFPSELGYAVRYGISDESRVELKMFNLKYIGK